ALSGLASGAAITGATLITAEAPTGVFIAVPLAAAGIGGDLFARAIIHVDMACDLAQIFGLRFDPDDPTDLWQLWALVFKTHNQESDDDDPGKELLKSIGETETSDIGESVGTRLLGESVVKNIVPFVDIVISSAANYRRTRELGDAMRRYLRY